MGRLRDWRWRRRIRRVMRREGAVVSPIRSLLRRSSASAPDPAMLRRAAEITDVRERRAAYEAAATTHAVEVSRGSRHAAILMVACAATVTFVLTVLAAIVGNPWVAATVAALVAGLIAGLARQRPVTRAFDHGLRARRLLRDVREPLDD
jgi:hypothetical protein